VVYSEKYGFSKVPEGVDNYLYGMGTGFLNLRKHLASKHTAAYDKAIVENNWNYCLSNEVKSSKSNTVEARKHSLPLFTQASLIVIAGMDETRRLVVASVRVELKA
jgi:hypothetical protein